jgi:hypothetical protein
MATATATATITTIAIMRTRVPDAPTRRAGRRRGCGSNGCLGGDLGLICKHGLLEGEHGASLAEGGERGGVGYVVGCGGELGVEAVDEVEDELGLGVIDVAKRVGEGFDALTVVSDRGIPLNKSVELIAKVDGVCHLVVIEEVEDRDVEGACSLIGVVHG